MKIISLISVAALLLSACAHTKPTEPNTPLATGTKAIHEMAGCYLVDYSYIETEAVKPGYQRDPRVYDVNKVKSVKEWIYADQISPRQIRLQHILFAADAKGQVVAGSELKHQAEDWEFSAPFLYEFVGPAKWTAVKLPASSESWTRRITNLDDGLRYQCSGPWKSEGGYPEWNCDNYSPIPGRETRDMQRKDYNALQRSTRVIVYDESWLERQNNTKIIDKENARTPLAKEQGKNWYVRLPDAECSVVRDYANQRKAFWSLLRETWDQVLTGKGPFYEKLPGNGPPRYAKMMQVEDKYIAQDLGKTEIRDKARSEILKVIEEYRITPQSVGRIE